MSTHSIRVTINGTVYESDVDLRTLLVHWIRDDLQLTGNIPVVIQQPVVPGTHHRRWKGLQILTMFAVQANGRQIITVEGGTGRQTPSIAGRFPRETCDAMWYVHLELL